MECISDDDIENILDDGDSSKGKDPEKTDDVLEEEEKPVAKQQPATKVDALDIAWETLRGKEDEKSEEPMEKMDENETKRDEGVCVFRLEVVPWWRWH